MSEPIDRLMAADDKRAFELKQHFNRVEIAVGDNLVAIEAGQVYETKDPDVIRALEQHDAVKTAEKPTKEARS
jgi:hypothetical protein